MEEHQMEEHHHQDPQNQDQAPNTNPPLPPQSPTQSPPLDSPHSSNHSSHASSLGHVSSPHEKPQSLALSISSVVTPLGNKPQGEEGRDGGVGYSGRRVIRPNLTGIRRIRREDKLWRRGLLGTRVVGFLFCLVSFSVLAADKNQGWVLDSFYRYKEFRYSMAVNVIGFAYSGVQASDLAYTLTTGKPLVQSQLKLLVDYALDQILAYLLLSASSSANFRVDDWESNWGKDKFPTMARASLAFSYLAFLAFAASSLLSGYALLTPKSR